SLFFRERRQPLHRRAIEDLIGVGRPIEHEREEDGREGRLELVELALSWQPHIDGTELDLLSLLGRAAKHIIGEDIDLYCTARPLFHVCRKLFGCNVSGMAFLRVMRPSKRERRRAAYYGRRAKYKPGGRG